MLVLFLGGLLPLESNHVLAYRHELLSDSKAREAMEELGLSFEKDKDKLPRILKSDPQIKILEKELGKEIAPGSIIKVHRSKPIYRLVVEG